MHLIWLRKGLERAWHPPRRLRALWRLKEEIEAFVLSLGRKRKRGAKKTCSPFFDSTTCPASASVLAFFCFQLVRGLKQTQRAAQEGFIRAKKQGERAERASENGSRQALAAPPSIDARRRRRSNNKKKHLDHSNKKAGAQLATTLTCRSPSWPGRGRGRRGLPPCKGRWRGATWLRSRGVVLRKGKKGESEGEQREPAQQALWRSSTSASSFFRKSLSRFSFFPASASSSPLCL